MPLTLPLLKVLAPVSKDYLDQLTACIVNHNSAMREIHDLEDQLCRPVQRTMPYIRSELAKIDNRYDFCHAQDKRVKELQVLIKDAERIFEAGERRKELTKKRALLNQEKTAALDGFTKVTAENLVSFQANFARILQEIEDTDEALSSFDALKTSKSATARKSKAVIDLTLDAGPAESDVKQGSKRSSDGATGARKKSRPAKIVTSDDENIHAPKFNHAEWGCDEDDKREEAVWADMTPEERLNYTGMF